MNLLMNTNIFFQFMNFEKKSKAHKSRRESLPKLEQYKDLKAVNESAIPELIYNGSDPLTAIHSRTFFNCHDNVLLG